MNISAIYKIESKLKPERIYVGGSNNITRRWREHLTNLRSQKHGNSKLQNHYNKYGETDLQFTILLSCEEEDLIKIEQYFIDSYTPYFNLCKIAGRQMGMKGRKHSEEFKRKIGNFHRGKHHSEETKQKIREKATGRHHSEETKNKISKIQKVISRIPHSEETKQKISISLIGNDYWKYRKERGLKKVV
jgi:group I intron endonuclease